MSEIFARLAELQAGALAQGEPDQARRTVAVGDVAIGEGNTVPATIISIQIPWAKPPRYRVGVFPEAADSQVGYRATQVIDVTETDATNMRERDKPLLDEAAQAALGGILAGAEVRIGLPTDQVDALYFRVSGLIPT